MTKDPIRMIPVYTYEQLIRESLREIEKRNDDKL